MKKAVIRISLIVIIAIASIYAIASIHALATQDQKYINFLIPVMNESEQKLMEEDWRKEKESSPALNYGQWSDEINNGFIKNFLLKEMSWKDGDKVIREEFHILLTYQNGEVYLGEVPNGTTRDNILDIYRFAQFKAPPILWQEAEAKTIAIKESIWKKLNLNNTTTVVEVIIVIAMAIGILWFLWWHTHRGKVKLPPPYRTNISFGDVKAPSEVLHLSQEITEMVKSPLMFLIKGGRIPHGFLFSGPPGTGKSVTAAALANELAKKGVLCYKISCTALLEDTLGDPGAAAARISYWFRQARNKKEPCLLIFDEVHLLFEKPEFDVAISQLLNELSGLEEYEASAYKEKKLVRSVAVLAITNKQEAIHEKSFLRSGRFGKIMKFLLPDPPARKDILEIHSRDKDLPADKKEEWLDWLAKKTENFNGADLQLILEKAATRCVEKINAKIREGKIVIPDETYLKEPEKLKSFLAGEKITFSDIQLAYLEVKDQKEKAV